MSVIDHRDARVKPFERRAAAGTAPLFEPSPPPGTDRVDVVVFVRNAEGLRANGGTAVEYEIHSSDGRIENARTLLEARRLATEAEPAALPIRIWLRDDRFVGGARLVEVVTAAAA